MRIQGSMCLDEMLPLEDQMPEVVVLDVLESCRCVEIKTKRETVTVGMLENVYTMLVGEARLF